jgi:hypothetical protein
MSTDLVQANTTLTTTPSDEAAELSTTQIAALDALLSGKTATDAAAAAGIGRRTLYNWLRQDYRFQAALNAGRKDLRQAIAHRLERLANDATECVGKAVREGDVKAALEIVKRLDVLAPRYLGSDDPDELAVDEAERQQLLAERGDRAENSAERRRDARSLRRLLS